MRWQTRVGFADVCPVSSDRLRAVDASRITVEALARWKTSPNMLEPVRSARIGRRRADRCGKGLDLAALDQAVAAAGGPAPALAMRQVSKAFGNVDVLRNVDFTLLPGEVHALMGENGAGKSTLMRVAGGIYSDYRGDMAVFGVPVRFSSPREASRAGVAVIHQELNLVPGMTVVENMFLGNEI